MDIKNDYISYIIESINESKNFYDIKHLEDTVYYHGSSSALDITDRLLPPNESNKLSEVGRNKNLDKVFFTKDKKSALIYAAKAVKQFGGEPVLFRVYPVGDIEVLNSNAGTTVFMAPWAYVEKIK